MSKVSDEQLYFVSSLDSVKQNQDNRKEIIRTKNILKLSSLFSENIILYDTQLVDNKGIQDLFLSDKNFQDFFCESITVGMRKDGNTFHDIVDKQIKNGMRYSSLPLPIQTKIERKEIKGLDHLNSLHTDLKLGQFVKILDEKYEESKNIKEIDYGSNYNTYPTRVKEYVENEPIIANFKNLYVKELCDQLMDMASKEMDSKKGNHITRSIFYSAIEKSPYSEEVKKTVKWHIIDKLYNENFWKGRGFNCFDHYSEKYVEFLNDVCTKNSFNNQKFNISYATFPNKINLDNIDFKFLKEFHSENKKEIKDNFSEIRRHEASVDVGKNKDAEYPIKEHISLLQKEICKLETNKTKKNFRNVETVTSLISLGTGCLSLPHNASTVISVGCFAITGLVSKIEERVIAKQELTLNNDFKNIKENIEININNL